MRVVLDTNVVVSGLLNPHGPPGRILDAVLAETIVVLHDDRILKEYREVLLRPMFAFQQSDFEMVVDFIESRGEHIRTKPLGLLLPDPDDLPFLEVAVSGNADALVTGNLKHFNIKGGQHGVYVCTPAVFLARTRWQ